MQQGKLTTIINQGSLETRMMQMEPVEMTELFWQVAF